MEWSRVAFLWEAVAIRAMKRMDERVFLRRETRYFAGNSSSNRTRHAAESDNNIRSPAIPQLSTACSQADAHEIPHRNFNYSFGSFCPEQ